uniref:Uncharacterized protein n=1 Tax=Acrobeloides nanus TaxID=290746 RepID=A0A914EDB6_9BILA
MSQEVCAGLYGFSRSEKAAPYRGEEYGNDAYQNASPSSNSSESTQNWFDFQQAVINQLTNDSNNQQSRYESDK